MATAKILRIGRSQAVRLPKAYHFETDEVTIERAPDGAVVLRAKPRVNLGERVRCTLEKAGDTADFERPEQGSLERDASWWDTQEQTEHD